MEAHVNIVISISKAVTFG